MITKKLGGNLLQHDHAPGVDDEFQHLCLVDRVQPPSDPVAAQAVSDRIDRGLGDGYM
jgi:hypothetical protein